ncbi:pentatricopeptide repeat-containing protein [Prunus yedoensis var. nudiflora]|uniref:Pentatricopeptide repeat-containing protein n=1 Tax=Prunus yedoensis var. nudiflora TaxID=2094558 RepID=A0A314UK41_PRUYE|nr:pentatricopeptide repeat-containing protein [Prunus yedoensis var. nudiflora]
MVNKDLVSWNAILSGYSQEGNRGLEAIFVFIEMVGEGMGTWETDTWLDNEIKTWKSCFNKEDAISLFNEMRLDGVYPNDVTFVGLISAISIRKLVEEGEMIHGFCIKTGFLSKHNVCNSLITVYAKFESMPDSIKGMLRTGCVKMH